MLAFTMACIAAFPVRFSVSSCEYKSYFAVALWGLSTRRCTTKLDWAAL